MSITEVKFKILGCFRTSLLKYSINNFFSTLKDEVSISKQCIYFHAKNEIFLSTRKSLFIKYVSQFCKLHRKLNFPNIFRLAAIYTRAPAFKLIDDYFLVHPFNKRYTTIPRDFFKVLQYLH